jgi:prevent-host-death family protein
MTVIEAGAAIRNLERLIKEVGDTHRPITIKGKDRSAILVGEEAWRSIQETLYLLSVPGVADSIRKGSIPRSSSALNELLGGLLEPGIEDHFP